jgi:hypothetical protein
MKNKISKSQERQSQTGEKPKKPLKAGVFMKKYPAEVLLSWQI